MTEQDIEREIQARVEFKMNELLTGIKNRVNFKYAQAFDMTQKSQDVWQAFKEVADMVKKEIEMATPSNQMVVQRQWEAKEKAVDSILDIFECNKGTREYYTRINRLVREIEKAQNY